MASYKILVISTNGEEQRKESNASAWDFQSVNIGADALPLVQGGSGASAFFDFGSRALRTSFVPLNANDLVTKSYSDNLSMGIKWKSPARLMSATNVALTGVQTLDSVLGIAGDRIFLAGQTAPAENGLWLMAAGAWTRPLDFDADSKIPQATFFIQEGTVYADSGWVMTTDGAPVLGTSALTFVQFTGGAGINAGSGLTKTGNTLNVIAGDNSITVNADDIIVKRSSSGAIVIDGANGIAVNLQASNPSLSIVANELGIKFNASGALESSATGIRSRVDSSSVKINASNNLAVNYSLSKTNDNIGAITIRQIVIIKANGNVDLATKANATYLLGIGVVEDASIAAAAAGNIFVKEGVIIPGFSALVPGRDYYVSTSGAIALYENLALAANENAFMVGKAMSATELKFAPLHKHSVA